MSRSTGTTSARTLAAASTLATASEITTRTSTTSSTNPQHPQTPQLPAKRITVVENELIRCLTLDIDNLQNACNEARLVYDTVGVSDRNAQLGAHTTAKAAVTKILEAVATLNSHRSQVDTEIENLLSSASGVVMDGMFAIGTSTCLSDKMFDVDQFTSLLEKRKRNE